MYYYLLSNVFHWDENAQKTDPNYPHAKKNILIFMIGSVLYLFTAGFLWSSQYQSLIQSILPLSIIKNFFSWFIGVDILTCLAMFKVYWGWGLLTELDGMMATKKSSNKNISLNNIINKEIYNNIVTTEGMVTEGITTESIVTEGITTEDIATEDIATEDIATEDI